MKAIKLPSYKNFVARLVAAKYFSFVLIVIGDKYIAVKSVANWPGGLNPANTIAIISNPKKDASIIMTDKKSID